MVRFADSNLTVELFVVASTVPELTVQLPRTITVAGSRNVAAPLKVML